MTYGTSHLLIGGCVFSGRGSRKNIVCKRGGGGGGGGEGGVTT